MTEESKRKERCREEGICIECGEEALPKCYSDAGRKEVSISGICEICFDNLFKNTGHG